MKSNGPTPWQGSVFVPFARVVTSREMGLASASSAR
jgi:hypothetical protein